MLAMTANEEALSLNEDDDPSVLALGRLLSFLEDEVALGEAEAVEMARYLHEAKQRIGAPSLSSMLNTVGERSSITATSLSSVLILLLVAVLGMSFARARLSEGASSFAKQVLELARASVALGGDDELCSLEQRLYLQSSSHSKAAAEVEGSEPVQRRLRLLLCRLFLAVWRTHSHGKQKEKENEEILQELAEGYSAEGWLRWESLSSEAERQNVLHAFLPTALEAEKASPPPATSIPPSSSSSLASAPPPSAEELTSEEALDGAQSTANDSVPPFELAVLLGSYPLPTIPISLEEKELQPLLLLEAKRPVEKKEDERVVKRGTLPKMRSKVIRLVDQLRTDVNISKVVEDFIARDEQRFLAFLRTYQG